MYTSFYKLKIKPFQISSDPDFLWLGEKHQEALATLKYGILDNKGFLLLTGDVGTGKTTLINSLIQSLSNDIICASVSDPSLSKLDFFNYIASSFGINQEFSSKGAFLVRFRKFLLDAHKIDKKILLIIDEAQLLTQELLEEIRLLSNIEKTNTKLINIFFVGQNEFNEILNQDQNRAVRQRLTLNYNIDPLTPDETDEYIQYRLKVAGAVQSIFEPFAVQEIFMYSGGFPRRINIICDHALLSGYVKDKETISAGIIQECAKELKIPAYVRNRDINGFTNYHQKPVPDIQSQSVLLRPIPPKKKGGGIGNLLIGIVGFFLFLIICWWILFPVSFQQVISDTNSHINFITNNRSKFLPEFLNPTILADSSKNRKNEYNQIEVLKDVGNKEEKIQIKKNDQGIANHQEKMTIPGNNIVISQKDIKKRIPEPLVQDELHEIIENKNLSENPIKSSNTSIRPNELKNEKKINPADQDGEMKKKILPLPEETIIVRFNYNTNDFTEEGFNKLKNFADILTMHPDAKILISGYTDSEGYQKYNIKLSEFRANIVRSFLLGRGINPDQIGVKGLGSINPVESNNTAWGRMMNRRVEIEILQ
ncbi:MAG: AAA family ATPase [Desulfobacula sp.]|uniref:AAA family ATPase n=1 Tax=Desulfobacula sp. TaxID=2593537 RepID=UPI0025BD384F|nr:AAA family ATPase [Desulfobacula sp.]MCD4720641.1 AAA family ATPase [Desulfobacula sp.]